MKKIICVGILVADIIVEPVTCYPEKGKLSRVASITMYNGGNAMTAALNLKKLGVPSAVAGMVGADMFGDFLRSKLEACGINTDGLKSSGDGQTSASVLMTGEDGERSFFHCTGANALFSESDIDYSVIDKYDAVFVTGTFLLDGFDGEPTAKFLKKCKEMGKTTFLDVCWDAAGRWGETLDMSIPYIDYLMPSIDEAICLTGKTDPDEIADVFASKGAKNTVIKLGSRGSYLRRAGEKKGKIFPPYKIEKPVDTTGAGDSFCSGFLAAYSRDESDDECMRIANAAGALCVTEKGATTGIRSYGETVKFADDRRAELTQAGDCMQTKEDTKNTKTKEN